MGWTKVEIPEEHKCDLPTVGYFNAGEIRAGDIIVCDCGQYWKLVLFTGTQWDPAPAGTCTWTRCDSLGRVY